MNVNIQREIEYTSKCFPDVKMKLRNLSTSEFRKSLIIHPEEKSNNGRIKKPVQIEYDMDIMFSCMVHDIKNLTITDEGKEVTKITNGRDILDNPGLNGLYLELLPILIKMEAKVDAKK
jgi:hypothetical protein